MQNEKFYTKFRPAESELKPKAEAVDEDSIETGDGRNSRHQVLAVQLVQASRDARAVLYGSIIGTIDYNPSIGIIFHFEGKDGVEKVTIKGNNLDQVYDRLCSGKREVIRENGQTVIAIEFQKPTLF